MLRQLALVSLGLVTSLPFLGAQQPTLIKDINTVPVGSGSTNTKGSYPNGLHLHEGLVYFAADDGKNGWELWKTDGTAAGTNMVMDRKVPKNAFVFAVISLGKRLLFHTTDALKGGQFWPTGGQLWATEGTAATTKLLTTMHLDLSPFRLIALGDFALFQSQSGPTVGTGSTGYSLWRTDGTPKGTFKIKMAKPVMYFYNPVEFKRRVYFAGSNVLLNNKPDYELWVTDGTASGTKLVKNLETGSSTLSPYSSFPHDFMPMGGELFFTASTGFKERLWKTDGTAKGTVLVNPVPRNSSVYQRCSSKLTVVGNKLFFGMNGRLWVSDGTGAGTKATGPTFRSPQGQGTLCLGPFVAFHEGVLFGAFVLGHGQELWGSNGSNFGMTDIAPGPASSYPRDFFQVGERELFFSAWTNGNGRELYSINRNLQVRLRHDINKRPVGPISYSSSSAPTEFTMLNGRVIFAADDGNKGRELWVLFPGATSQPLGRGCGVGSTAPTLRSLDDPVLGRNNTYTMAGATPKAGGLVFVGLPARRSVPYPGGCRLYVDLGTVHVPVSVRTKGNGTWSTRSSPACCSACLPTSRNSAC